MKNANIKDTRHKSGKNNRSNPKSRNARKSYGKEYDKSTEHEESSVSKTNDLSWYMSNTQLVNDAAKIPFGNQLGRALDGVITEGASTVPGVCAISTVPGPGIATSVTDAVNISATNIFQFIRKNLSTYASYAAADVMMYIMAVDELYSMYNHILRAFGMVNNFSASNLYLPNALMKAYGFDYDAIQVFRKNMNDYRAQFNNLIYKAASIYMPIDISIVKRHMWLFGNYFADAESAKAQLYMYVPAGYHILDETTSDNGTMLKWHKFDYESLSMAELLDVFDNMIESIRNSDSMLKIAADMRRAYENSMSWTLSYIPENVVVLPIVDHNVLHQVMNSVIHSPSLARNLDFDITQSVEHNKILYQPKYKLTSNNKYFEAFDIFCQEAGLILNFFKPNVETGDIVEATRNISLFKYDPDDNSATFYTAGADICVGATIYYMVPEATGDFAIGKKTYTSYMQQSSVDHVLLSLMHTFDWCPQIYIFNPEGSVPFKDVIPFVQYDNYTQVKGSTIKLLNEGVLTSMWQVPDFRLPTVGSNQR